MITHTFFPGLIVFGVLFTVSTILYLIDSKGKYLNRKITAFLAAGSAMMMCGMGTFAPRILDLFSRILKGALHRSDIFTLIAMGLGLFAGATLVRVIRYRHQEKRGKYAMLTLTSIIFIKVMISSIRLMG